MLSVVATPIGNLADITERAKQVLASADYILAEDTRISAMMLSRILGSYPPLKACHDFNERDMVPIVISWLKEGKKVAIISDAGTPGIADPAYHIVRAAIQNNIPVSPIPGASSIIAALVCSGLPTDRFVFENYIPKTSSKRIKLFESLKNEKRTIIFFESPYRIKKSLQQLHHVLGDVHVVIAREMTKIYEEFLRGTPQSLGAHFERNKPRGEMVVIFNPRVYGEHAEFLKD